jgi:hypothetical protein
MQDALAISTEVEALEAAPESDEHSKTLTTEITTDDPAGRMK